MRGIVREQMNIKIAHDGPVTTITLNRPECRNAVDPTTARELQAAFVAFDRTPDSRVAVLTGTGDAFCAGFDLKQLADGPRDWLGDLHFGDNPRDPALGPMGPTRLDLSKPVIAAVNGAAGTLNSDRALITTRPFRSPHHTVSEAGLLGGSSQLGRVSANRPVRACGADGRITDVGAVTGGGYRPLPAALHACGSQVGAESTGALPRGRAARGVPELDQHAARGRRRGRPPLRRRPGPTRRF